MKGLRTGYILVMIVGMMMNTMKIFAGNTRPTAVAGQFYPAQRQELEADVKRYLAAATPAGLGDPVRAVIVPLPLAFREKTTSFFLFFLSPS